MRMIVITAVVGALIAMGLGMHAFTNRKEYQTPLGLKLVAKYEPLHLYIYADTATTNKRPDYLICQGNNDLIYRENTESNTIETTHFEDGRQVLLTRRDQNGKILKRTVFYIDDAWNLKYSYIDKNGNGLWDVFLDEHRHMYYVRSNLCWILRFQDTNSPQRSLNSTD